MIVQKLVYQLSYQANWGLGISWFQILFKPDSLSCVHVHDSWVKDGKISVENSTSVLSLPYNSVSTSEGCHYLVLLLWNKAWQRIRKCLRKKLLILSTGICWWLGRLARSRWLPGWWFCPSKPRNTRHLQLSKICTFCRVFLFLLNTSFLCSG